MKNQRQQSGLKKYTHHLKYGAAFIWAFTGTMLIASSVVQASDLQIYAVPTAGQKTIVMMLDTSGSMGPNSASGYSFRDYGITSYCNQTPANGNSLTSFTSKTNYYVTSSTNPTYSRNFCYYSTSDATATIKKAEKEGGCEAIKNSSGTITGYRCYDRLTRLKDGMFAFLDSANSTFNSVSVGLGHFSINSGKAGKILVPAAKLGKVDATQRANLREEVAGLTASSSTPTANAYAEAAAYLMGTTTIAPVQIKVDMYKKQTTSVFDRYACQNSSYRYLNSANNLCYQNNTGFSGSSQTASDKYTCPPSGNPAYAYIGTNTSTTKKRCYKTIAISNSANNSTSDYKSADITKTCENSSYDYLNTADSKCYQYQNFSGGTQNPSQITRDEVTYYRCDGLNSTNFSAESQTCRSWSWISLGAEAPSDLVQDGNYNSGSDIIYYKNEWQTGSNSYSGFSSSVDSSKSGTNYISPLPAEADRVSCDGQGVYLLSDGIPSSNPDSSVMASALQLTSFSNSGGLSNGATEWAYMSNFAKKLFNAAQNPAGVSIQTAFVGFGAELNSLGTNDAINACKLSSRTQTDRAGDDKCSPNQGTNAVANPGYGNGGFFPTQTASGVTDSVIAFINNLGPTPLAPLTTGAISVPADALSPSGLQPYGYLRALEPDPQSGKLAWAGNLKRYKVLTTGANAGAFAGANGSTLVYNADGSFKAGTKDLWNSSSVYNNKSYNDGGIIGLGGAYSRVPMPINGQIEDITVTPPKYEFAANPNGLRKLFTDVAATGGAALTGAGNGASLLRIPEGPLPTTNIATYVLDKFNNQTTLKDMSLSARQALLNYLGYSVPLDATATTLPTTLPISATPHLAMGGSIHSFPVQMTYSGTLDASGNLTSTRSQSILYGTMEGGLHIVDSSTGVEQMVFVPAELLRNTTASKALVRGETDASSPQAGLDGAWVADSLYVAQKASSSSEDSVVKASRMNVYGGLRMGGESYYGLNVLDPTSPKFLFRIGRDQTDFSRMGQSWSKPVLANIRYNNEIRRVMIVGGGYDQCYENPKFEFGKVLSYTTVNGVDVPTDFPDASCDNRTEAKGNAVYIVDATTGERLWWTSNTVTGVGTANTNMKHSIVSRISAIDRNGDGLIDHLYFGDLGGQVFRADLNNTSGTTTTNFGKRVVRLANLATDSSGVALTGGKNPRFYEAPTVTIHDQGATSFIVVGIAAGNRSTPLDVYPIVGREGMKPVNALSDRLVNNVYGLIDRDFIKKNLFTEVNNSDGTAFALSTQNIDIRTLQKDPQLLSGNIPSYFIGTSATKNGWYRSLSSNSLGVERADDSFRIKGGMKAFEEPIALTGNLLIPVYDPQGTGIAPQNPCLPRVVGETNRQRYCLPFGVCLKSDSAGTGMVVNEDEEKETGFKTKKDPCPEGVKECNDNTLGAGIVGITPAPIEETTDGSCPNFTIAGNEKGTGLWKCVPTINPTRWYEKWKK